MLSILSNNYNNNISKINSDNLKNRRYGSCSFKGGINQNLEDKFQKNYEEKISVQESVKQLFEKPKTNLLKVAGGIMGFSVITALVLSGIEIFKDKFKK